MWSNRKVWITVAVGSVAALLLAVGAGFAFAPATQAAAGQTQNQVLPGQSMGRGMFGQNTPGRGLFGRGAMAGRGVMGGGMYGGRGAMAGANLDQGELLANALGITTDALQTAHTDAWKAIVNQAVTDGKLTQAQADRMLSGALWGGRGLAADLQGYDFDTYLAKALNISVDELQSAHDNAISKGVEAGLLTKEQGNALTVGQRIRDAVQAARDAAIKQAVTDGLLTQEQADAMTQGQGWGMFGMGAGYGMHGMHGRYGMDEMPGMYGRMGGQRGFGRGWNTPGQNAPKTTPKATPTN